MFLIICIHSYTHIYVCMLIYAVWCVKSHTAIYWRRQRRQCKCSLRFSLSYRLKIITTIISNAHEFWFLNQIMHEQIKLKTSKKNPNKQINQRTKTPARREKITTRINKYMCIELVCNKFMNKYIRSECVYGCVRIETMQIRMVHTIHITSHKQTHTICRGKSTFKWFLPSVLPFNKWHIYQIKILDSVQKTNK